MLVILGIIGYFSVRGKADRALQSQGLLEALRMLNTGGLDDEITKLLDKQMPKWPITDEIKRAIVELQSLKSGLDAAMKAGVPQNLIGAFKQDTLKALDQMWHLAERVSGAGAQKVEYASLAGQMNPIVEQVRQVSATAKDARRALAQMALTDHDASQADLRDAEEHLRDLSAATSALVNNTKEGLGK
ncbi:MAG: hypothetical protein ABIQ44_03205 [Chloroflexia bacterium]